MAKKFHVNDDGEVRPCSAEQGNCPFGGGENHFTSIEEGRKAYEQRMADELIPDKLTSFKIAQAVAKKYENNIERKNWYNNEGNYAANDLEYRKNNKLPFTQEAFERRRIYAEEIIKELVELKQDTESQHSRLSVTGDRIYTEERQALHRKIVDSFLDSVKNVPSDGKVLFAGGLGGAGKSTVLQDHARINQKEYATLNPDDVKEKMAEMEMIPQVHGLTPMEASPLVHEEASRITSLILEKLRKDKKNIIFDITMSSEGSVQKRIDLVKKSGYKKITAIFVDIKPKTSLSRGNARYLSGMNRFTESNNGKGGRLLPESVITDQAPSNDLFNSKNAEVFKKIYMNDGFTHTPLVFNNNVDGRAPVRVNLNSFLFHENK